MPPLKTYRLLISHAWAYNAGYYRLVSLLDNAKNFRWCNYSVPEHDPADASNTSKLETALQDQMRPTQAVLIISGMYAAYSEWIQYEIDLAVGWDKPIIGIRPWGSQRIPTAVSSVAKEMVGWNTSSIVAAIRKHSL